MLLGRHIRTPRFEFVLSSANVFQVRKTLLVVNLQLLVAPSRTGAKQMVLSRS